MKVTILGCCPSWGVPPVGGAWGACDPANPKNRRRRVSVLVEEGDASLLVDASPDLRAQLLDAGVRRLDAVLFTHDHADHLHGIDDLRGINILMRRAIPAYATEETLAIITARFGYVFAPLPPGKSYYFKPVLTPVAITGRFSVADIEVVPFAQNHGHSTTLGFRFGRFAYSTDGREARRVGLSDACRGGGLGGGLPARGAASDPQQLGTDAWLDRPGEASASGADPHGRVA
jgi:phosphoribosyl 1,2-cyclic phosphate phosphodiesterase